MTGQGKTWVFVTVAMLALGAANASAVLIAGVDFEGATQATFNRTPDDLAPLDGISVSSGTNSAIGLFDGWTILNNAGGFGVTGDIRNDAGANGAGATTPNFPARLESNRTASWAINIPNNVTLNLDRVEFDVRAATDAAGRDGFFNTSLDGANLLWSNTNLPGRTSGNWIHIVVDLSGPLYQNLTNQSVDFIWRTNTSGAIDFDTLQVYGTIAAAVPEPATAGLGLLGLAALLRRRHRIA